MDALGHALNDLAPQLFALLVRGTLLLAIAAGVVRLLGGASASVRHLVWASALSGLLILPVVSLVVPTIEMQVLPAAAAVEEATSVVEGASASVATVPDEISALPASGTVDVDRVSPPPRPPVTPSGAEVSASVESGTWGWTWRAVAVVVWGIVALVLLGEIARSRLRLRRLAASSWRIHDPVWWRAASRIGATLGLRRPVTLLATRSTSIPLTWGTRSPVVLLPADAVRWPPERREAVLVHELAHVARGDAIGHDVGRIAAALFWINPLVWIALRGMRSERERACDDLVLETGTRASSYAGDLLEIARSLAGRTPAAAAALAMARPRELEGRLLAILNPEVSRRPASRGVRAVAAVCAVLMVVPLAALRPAERGMAPPSDSVAEAESITKQIARQPESPMASPSPPPASGQPAAVPPAAEVPVPAPYAAGSEMPPLIDAVAPLSPEIAPGAVPAPPSSRAAASEDDLATLVAVANAAAGPGSDSDKAELLLEVIARDVRSDSLQRVILRAATTVKSAYERGRVLTGMLRRGLAAGTEVLFLETTAGVLSAHEQGQVLSAFARGDRLAEPRVRAAYLGVVATIKSEYERQRLLRLVMGQPGFDAAAALEMLPVIRALTSDYEKAELLIALARRGVTSDADVRDAFLIAAASIKSSYEYGRVVDAARLRPSDPR